MSKYALFCEDCECFQQIATNGDGVCGIRHEKCNSSNICHITNGVDDYYDIIRL